MQQCAWRRPPIGRGLSAPVPAARRRRSFAAEWRYRPRSASAWCRPRRNAQRRARSIARRPASIRLPTRSTRRAARARPRRACDRAWRSQASNAEIGRPLLNAAMEFGGGAAEPAGIEADVVARHEPAVAIEGGILHGFRAQRRTQLLESGKGDCLLRIGPGADARSPEPPAQDFDQPPVTRQACAADEACSQRVRAPAANSDVRRWCREHWADLPRPAHPRAAAAQAGTVSAR